MGERPEPRRRAGHLFRTAYRGVAPRRARSSAARRLMQVEPGVQLTELSSDLSSATGPRCLSLSGYPAT